MGMTAADPRPAAFGAMPIAGIDRYQAGGCNIGPAEIARRRRVGLVGLAVAAALVVLLLVVDAPSWLRLVIAVPLAGGLVSLQQVRKRFCVGFAMAGLRNLGELGRVERVTDASDRAADRRAAIRLALPPAVLGVALALAFATLPV